MYTNKYYNTVPAIELNSVYWSNDIIYDAKYNDNDNDNDNENYLFNIIIIRQYYYI